MATKFQAGHYDRTALTREFAGFEFLDEGRVFGGEGEEDLEGGAGGVDEEGAAEVVLGFEFADTLDFAGFVEEFLGGLAAEFGALIAEEIFGEDGAVGGVGPVGQEFEEFVFALFENGGGGKGARLQFGFVEDEVDDGGVDGGGGRVGAIRE